jgi:hypothetical protein
MNKEIIKLPEYVYNEKFDVYIKPYLELGEVELIAKEILKTDNWCEREQIRNQYLIQFCVKNPEELNGMEYDALKYNGFFEALEGTVHNSYDLDEYIYHESSTSMIVGEFLKSLIELATKAEKKIPKRKELEATIDAFMKTQETHNQEVQNKEAET